jgi:hypothetical protein
MTPDVYLCNEYLPAINDSLVLYLGASVSNTSTTILRVHVTPATAAAVATATCDFLVRLFATCEQGDLSIHGGGNASLALSGAGLSLFFQESRDSLQKFTLQSMALSEDLCLALATMSRLDVELNLNWCSLEGGSADAFVECLQSDRGPIKLHRCEIDSQILANALTGDSRVTRLKPHFHGTDDAEADLFRVLANSRGLANLDLQRYPISDENWTGMCQSLQAHPILTSLGLYATRPCILSAEQKTHRTRLLADMVQWSTALYTVELSESHYNQQIYTEEIHPYLETNQYRPRVHAIKKTLDRPFREKVLGRALYSVRSNPNLVWMLLSENVDAFVRSGEEEEESNSEVPVAVAAVVVVAVSVASSKRKR